MIIIFDPRQQSMSFLEARLHFGDDDGESAKFMKFSHILMLVYGQMREIDDNI